MFISMKSLYSTITYFSDLETVLHITVLRVKTLWLSVFVGLPYHFPHSFGLFHWLTHELIVILHTHQLTTSPTGCQWA